ncbi:MAG: hypothetical protein ACFFD2_02195 [Promethearchaeota archaeon]
MAEANLTELKDSLKKVLELIFLIEKDISGVRLRSSNILKQEGLKEQVDIVIRTIEEDVKKVEMGVNPLRRYFLLRNNALNAINNLTSSLNKTINESKTIEEVREVIRMFSKDAQEDFVHTILQLEELWNQEIKEIMESMKKVISIMQVTHEKILRYKQECNIKDGVGSDVERLLDLLFNGNIKDFEKKEHDLRTRLLPDE